MSIGSKFALHTLWLAGPKWAAGLLHTLKTKGEQHQGKHQEAKPSESDAGDAGDKDASDWDKTMKPNAEVP